LKYAAILRLDIVKAPSGKINAHQERVNGIPSFLILYQEIINTTPSTLYFSPRDYFLKSAKVFGEDIQKVKRIFDSPLSVYFLAGLILVYFQ